MTPKFWILLTEADTVQPFYDLAEAEAAAAVFVQSCDDSRIVTVENWRAELAGLNAEMDDAGEAGYLCTLTEHALPDLRALAVLEDGEVRRVETDSLLLRHLKVAVVETKFRQIDYHPDDIFKVDTGRGLVEAVGHIQGIQTPEWPIATVFERIAATDPVHVA
jgi:hypothetical protein